ncbi:hypothetical protein [Kitasatospora cinereorecta]|uniref:Uncharacterized protein n=1 Tax=Kitasatospora cinereorecta TaxID=285560 RepID=A0ABW0V3Q5_9ACTN
MADGAGGGGAGGRGGVAPMVWAFVVRDEGEDAVAEAVVEVDASSHAALLEDAYDSGFTVAAGNPPVTTAVAHVEVDPFGEARLTYLVLGARQVWMPVPAASVPPRWLAAARTVGRVAVLIVPPDTWPRDLPDREPEVRTAVFVAGLAQARASGLAMHGSALLFAESAAEGRPE